MATELSPTPRLRHLCSWCLVVLDEGAPGASITHGMCPRCEERFRNEAGLSGYESVCLVLPGCSDPCPACERALAEEAEEAAIAAREEREAALQDKAIDDRLSAWKENGRVGRP
jgi:hypothetical protein